MKKTGLIITILVTVIMVVAITVKMASQEETSNQKSDTYQDTGAASTLKEGMIGITAAKYDEQVTNSKGILVIDYFAPTCSYCIKYTPVFSSVFEQYKDRASFGKFDVTTDRDKISTLNIEGTPATIFFKDGKEIDRINGYVDEATLKAKVDVALKK